MKEHKRMPIYVEPYYNSDPFKIEVGEYSNRLKTNSPRQLLTLANDIKERVDEVNIQTLSVLAIRLYDLGEKDAASYWYYTAQFRKNIFLKMVDRSKTVETLGNPIFETRHALQSFKELSGQWINGHSYGEPDKLVAILEQVLADCATMGYIAKAYPRFPFKPESEQKPYVDEEIETFREHGIKFILENKEDILRQRKENGIEGKY